MDHAQELHRPAHIAVKEDWEHGDEPQAHPMWEDQLDLEYGMMRQGANKLRDLVITATEDRQMTQVPVVRGLMTDWVPGVAKTLMEWRMAWARKKGGVKPVILPMVAEIDPYVAALVGLREIMDRIGQSENTVQNIAMGIGRTLEHEQKVRMWESMGSEADKALWAVHQRSMKANKVTSGHRRRTNINRFNHHLKEHDFENVSWTPWSQDTCFRIGWTIMDCVVRHTQWFQVVDDPDHQYRKGRPNSPKLKLMAKEGLTDYIAEALDHAELHQPDFGPTVMPPKPWSTGRNGGYWTPYVKAPRLIRFKASQPEQQEGAADEYDAVDMPRVYRSINFLQDTAYRINTQVLRVFEEVWTVRRWTSVKGCLPALNDRMLPLRTPRMMEHQAANKGRRGEAREKPDAETEQEIFEWKRAAAPVHSFNAKRTARAISAKEIMRIANAYEGYDTIYFPHMLDFRGRIYPVCSYLHPQGNDLARGLLEYGTGAVITEENGGVRWLAICLASNWGHDKLSYQERVDWVLANEPLLRRIALDPIGNDEWFHSDKPWQALSQVFEWVAYLDAAALGEPYSCSSIGYVDGTCNGIQHLSAILRDEVAGEYVNLVPGERPRDIYKFVAEDLQATLERIRHGGGLEGAKAAYWLDLCGPAGLPRSLTKRQVMVLPYGGTKDSFFGYTREWLDEHHPLPDGATKELKQERTAHIVFLTLHMWDSVKANVKSAEMVMKWLQECARFAAIENQPIVWVTPSGMVVRHFYGLYNDKRVDLTLDGTRCTIQLAERTSTLSLKEQLQGIAPNFVHSLDASCLVDCLNACQDVGIKSFSSVHDAYGTHMANMDILGAKLREAFVKTHEVDVLGLFRQSCIEVVVPAMVIKHGVDPLDAFELANEKLPKPLALGKLDLYGVLESDYFFA